jgi:hypothetical protein
MSIVMQVKDILPYPVRAAIGKADKMSRYAALWLRSGGRGKKNFQCNACGSSLYGFVCGGKLCPFCISFPRHRALLPLIDDWTSSSDQPTSLLNVAPDACMRPRLLANRSIKYKSLDRFTPGHYYPPDTIHGDIEELGDFQLQDLVVILHVLEHVNDDYKALSEIFRILKPGGCAILAFPYRDNKLTYEDPSITEPSGRAVAFGQWDHVRWYGRDVIDRISSVGFQTRKITTDEIWSPDEIIKWGLIPNETFFLCKKEGHVSSLSTVKI